MNSFDSTPSEHPSSRKCGTGCRRSVEGSRRCLKRDQASASCGNNTCQTESHFRPVSVCAVVRQAWEVLRRAAMRAAALYQDDSMPVESISTGGASALGESLVKHGSWPIGAWDVRFPRRHTLGPAVGMLPIVNAFTRFHFPKQSKREAFFFAYTNNVLTANESSTPSGWPPH